MLAKPQKMIVCSDRVVHRLFDMNVVGVKLFWDCKIVVSYSNYCHLLHFCIYFV